MKTKISNSILGTGCLLVLLYCGAAFLPPGMSWGFNFLTFLPWPAAILYLAGIVALAALIFSSNLEGSFRQIVLIMRRARPQSILYASILLFCAAAWVFRVTTPLLGDSFKLLANFSEARTGSSPLAPWNEPLSIFALYHASNVLGNASFPELSRSFFLIGMVLGCGFIVNSWFIAGNLFRDSRRRLLTFILLVTLPYMVLFMGYIETYAVSMYVLSLFVLCSVLVMKGRLTFMVLPVLYLAAALSHAMYALLGCSVLYLAFLEYRRRRLAGVLVGAGIAVLALSALLLAIGFQMDRIMDVSPVSHFLSVTEQISAANAYTQPYTLFSPWHLLDLLNYFLLMSPFALLIIGMWALRYGRRLLCRNRFGIWALSAVTPLIMLLLVSKLELGAANDWDIFASVFFLVNLLAAFLFFHAEPPSATRTWVIIAGITALNTLVWLTLNASTGPAIRRFQSLWDKRNLSHMGRYAAALQLSRYSSAEGDSSKNPGIWESYAATFPEDPRGYANAIEAIGRGDTAADDMKLQLYRQWLTIDPSNSDLRSRAMSAYIAAANSSLNRRDLAKAYAVYLLASRIEPKSPDAYNGLGSVEAEEGHKENAIALFQKAIQLDSEYVYPYENLATLYDELGDKKQSARYRALAAALKSRRGVE